jgi:hypothetical protein
MKTAVAIVLLLDVLNLIAFAAIAIRGVVHGVNYPFPIWFRNERDLCFYLGIILAFASLPFLAFRQHKQRALLSLGLSFGTVMVIAFLTSIG